MDIHMELLVEFRRIAHNIRGINDRFNVVYALLGDECRDYYRRIYGHNKN